MRLTIVDELKSLLVGLVLTVCTAVAALTLMDGPSYPSDTINDNTPSVVHVGVWEEHWPPRVLGDPLLSRR